jgi:hypothetical protein
MIEIKIRNIIKKIDSLLENQPNKKDDWLELINMFHEELLKTNKTKINENPTIEKNRTFRILQENSSNNGLTIPQIQKLYKNRCTLTTNYHQISKHIEELENEKRIYRVNPDAKRCIRYASLGSL